MDNPHKEPVKNDSDLPIVSISSLLFGITLNYIFSHNCLHTCLTHWPLKTTIKQWFKHFSALKKTTTRHEGYSEVYLRGRLLPDRYEADLLIMHIGSKQLARNLSSINSCGSRPVINAKKLITSRKRTHNSMQPWYLLIPGMVQASWEKTEERRKLALKLVMVKLDNSGYSSAWAAWCHIVTRVLV